MSWLSKAIGKLTGADAAKAAQADAKRMQADIQAREDKRQADIRAGQGHISDAFLQFNPAFYDNFQNTYKANYLPQIGDQYAEAKDKLTATLAGRGMLESTTGANAFGKIQKTKNDAETKVANSAADAANELRGRVENTKSNLFNLNLSAADPASVGAQANAAASSIVSPQAYPDLGNVFSAALGPFNMANKADFTSMNPSLPWNRFGAPSATGSGTIKI